MKPIILAMVKGMAAALVIVSLISLGVYRAGQWKNYAATHHCVPVGDKLGDGEIGWTNGHGIVVFTQPGETVYQCDGGEIHIR